VFGADSATTSAASTASAPVPAIGPSSPSGRLSRPSPARTARCGNGFFVRRPNAEMMPSAKSNTTPIQIKFPACTKVPAQLGSVG